MTICPKCKPWAATTHRQLNNRIANMVHSTDVQNHRCPKCGGTEWAVTDAMIQNELETHSWGKGWDRNQVVAGLAIWSAVIVMVLVLIGWWK